ncbi:MAG: DNA primase [Verrucomicrobiota bacterium]
MAMIPKETIEEIRSRCNVVEVVGSYLPQLKRRGSTFKCNCPFHQEKTPSFTVNETRQIFHCFGCGAGGDIFRFVMEYEKVDFVTAVKILAERAGVEIVYEGGQPEKSGDKDALYKIHREAAAFYHRLLTEGTEGAEARRYLEERDLPADLLKEFQVGFAPNEWDGLMKRALKKGYTAEQLEAAGLVVPSERNGKTSHYDRFRNRVMFPICDPMGRVIGFSGRIMNKAEKGAKYVNSPETLLFRKNQVLFAFDKARKPIVEARQAIVVEGQIDAMRCHQAGLTNVVASQGTALTENHARLIKRYADEVVLVLDADAAGVKAALASSEIFIATELSVRVVTLPEKEDPDSLIRKNGAEALTALVKDAPAALDFLVECLGRQEDMTIEAGRMRVVKAVLNLIRHCPSAARRDSMIHRAADLLHISPQALGQDLRREQRKQRPAPRRAEADAPAAAPPKTYPKEEISLMELLVHHYPDVQPLVHDYLPSRYLTDPVCRELVELLMVDLPETLTEGFQDFDEERQRIISRIQVEESRAIDEETSPIELAQRYILLFWKRQLECEQAALSQRAELSNEERFKEGTRIRHDLHVLSSNWAHAQPMIEARLHEAP